MGICQLLMKKLFTALTVCAIGLCFITVNGCKREAAAPPAKTTSAEKTSFNDVTSKLDAGGNFYLYLSTEQWLENLSGKISGWREGVASMPPMAEHRAQVDQAFDAITRLVKDSGVEKVSGVGMSSIAIEPGLYHSKTFLHHYAGDGSGFVWTMFGKEPHDLAGLNLLTTNTAMAMFSDMDLPGLWSVLQQEGRQSGIPEVTEFFNAMPEKFEQSTGLKWADALKSLGGEYGFVITFDETKKIPIPLPTRDRLEIPEPGMMLVVKVNDDAIFKRIDAALEKTHQQVIRVDQSDLKMRTVPVPLPLPIQLRPSVATSGGYLFIASSDSLIQDSLAVKAGSKPGLAMTAEFKHLAKDVPTKGNQFCFLSQRFGQKIMEVQRQALAMQTQNSGESAWLNMFLNPDSAAYAYSVGVNTPEGWLTIGNGNQSGGKVLMASTAVVPGMLAAIAIPNFIKARQTAQKNACINNLRQIDAAKQQWALEKNKKEGDVPTMDDLKEYIGRPGAPLPHCPQGGTYTIGSVGEAPRCSIPGHSLTGD